MNPRPLKGQQAVAGEGQGFIGLPIRKTVEAVRLNVPGFGGLIQDDYTLTGWQSLWVPDANELALLNAGVPVLLTVLNGGGPHPPVRLEVKSDE